jgi:hypothetical protein
VIAWVTTHRSNLAVTLSSTLTFNHTQDNQSDNISGIRTRAMEIVNVFNMEFRWKKIYYSMDYCKKANFFKFFRDEEKNIKNFRILNNLWWIKLFLMDKTFFDGWNFFWSINLFLMEKTFLMNYDFWSINTTSRKFACFY